MIRRIVVFKMKENAEGCNATENAEQLAKRFNALKYELPFLVDIKAGECINDICGYHMGLSVDYSCEQDIERYTNHPSHVKVKEYVGKIIENRIMADFVID